MHDRLSTVGRRFGAALVFGLVALWIWAAAAKANAVETPAPDARGNLVVVLEDDAARAVAARLASELDGLVVGSIPQLGAYLLELPWLDRPGAAFLRGLEGRSGVERAEAVGSVRLAETPAAFDVDDPLLGSAWHLTTIKADVAWAAERGDPSVVIAVVDTGVDYNHPDLAGKVLLGPDLASGDSNPIDGQGHGTHVAGIAAAKADNGVGSAGVCPDCSVLAVKVFADGASSASTFTIAQGITWAVDNGADVVNLSLGGTNATTVMRDAVDYAWSHGVVVVAAAGNSATPAQHYPAAYPNAIAVGSTTSSDALSSFSNYGSWVDLVAPGSGILSTIRGGGYQSWSGTSMATPVVAGAAGLAIAADPDADASATRAAVEAAVVDLGATGRDATFGNGRVALDQLALGEPEPPGPPPAPTPPAIVTSSLPAGVVGTVYSATLAATAGTPPYSWSVVDGALPAGLTLSAAGALTGTPTAAGSVPITVQVTDANGLADSGSFTVSIAPAPRPDLAGSWRSARRYGSWIRGEFRLQLSGAAVAATTVRFQLVTSSGGVLSQRDVNLTSLAPGTRTLTVDFTRPSGSGTLRLRAVIDPAGIVAESNEQNNAADLTVR